jgi:hypothetical protein
MLSASSGIVAGRSTRSLAGMRSSANANIEHHYFEQFRSHFSLPPGEIEYGDKPDVVLRGERKIGIEIVRLYLVDGSDPAAEQIQSGWRHRVLESAQRAFLANGGRRIELTLSFNPRHPIKDVKSVAGALASIAPRIAEERGGEVRRALFAHIPEIAFVYHNPREYTDARWRLAQTYTTPLLAVERVLAIVESKHEKTDEYAQCDALWLLVIVDFADRAQDQDIRWPDAANTVPTKFERVIIYKPQFAESTEVPVTHAS